MQAELKVLTGSPAKVVTRHVKQPKVKLVRPKRVKPDDHPLVDFETGGQVPVFKVGRTTLTPVQHAALEDTVVQVAQLITGATANLIEVGDQVNNMKIRCGCTTAELHLRLAEKKIGKVLSKARLDQYAKTARYVPFDLRRPGLVMEDYYEIVRHCDQMVKSTSPEKSRVELEPDAKMIVGSTVELLLDRGRKFLTGQRKAAARKAERRADDAAKQAAAAVMSNDQPTKLNCGWWVVREATSLEKLLVMLTASDRLTNHVDLISVTKTVALRDDLERIMNHVMFGGRIIIVNRDVTDSLEDVIASVQPTVNAVVTARTGKATLAVRDEVVLKKYTLVTHQSD